MALVGGRAGVGGVRARSRCKQGCSAGGGVAGGEGLEQGPQRALASLGCDGSLHLGLAQGQSLGPWGISVLALLSPLCVPSVRGWCHATELTTAPRTPRGDLSCCDGTHPPEGGQGFMSW